MVASQQEASPRCFDSLFFLIGWMIWKERNAKTFNEAATSAVQLRYCWLQIFVVPIAHLIVASL